MSIERESAGGDEGEFDLEEMIEVGKQNAEARVSALDSMREAAEEKLSKESYIKDHIDYVSRLFGEPVSSISEIKFEPIPEDENEE